MIKVGINGFGRIGRAIFRINEYNPVFEISVINDIDPLVENHVYLANYDSVYGSLINKVSVSNNKKFIKNRDQEIAFYSNKNIYEIPWKEHDVDIVIDSSGVHDNVINSYKLIKQGNKRIAQKVLEELLFLIFEHAHNITKEKKFLFSGYPSDHILAS